MCAFLRSRYSVDFDRSCFTDTHTKLFLSFDLTGRNASRLEML